jgi:hypothetical protein
MGKARPAEIRGIVANALAGVRDVKIHPCSEEREEQNRGKWPVHDSVGVGVWPGRGRGGFADDRTRKREESVSV